MAIIQVINTDHDLTDLYRYKLLLDNYTYNITLLDGIEACIDGNPSRTYSSGVMWEWYNDGILYQRGGEPLLPVFDETLPVIEVEPPNKNY